MSERAPHLILGLEKMHFNRLYKKFSMLNLSNRWLRSDWIIAEKYLQIKKNPTCQWILSSSGCQLIQRHSAEGQDLNVWRWLWLMPGTDSQERWWSHLFVSVNQVAHRAVFGQPHAMLVFSTSNWVKCGANWLTQAGAQSCGMWQCEWPCPLLELNSVNLDPLMASKPAAYLCERKTEFRKEAVLFTFLRYPLNIYKMPRDSDKMKDREKSQIQEVKTWLWAIKMYS